MDRYQQVIDVAESIKPKTIVEIGTYKGLTAYRLIEMAKKYHEKPIYWGFDAFDWVEAFELPYLDFPTLESVTEKLTPTGAEIHLVKGNTRESVKNLYIPDVDFVYIDGGHSIETIESDWNWVKSIMNDKTVVVFDDYYLGDDTKGAKKIIDSLEGYNVEFLPPTNYPQYIVHFVKVWKK